ncbi:response regulator transcription factor [bacterium]|nr:response regulator transcription factor [bacterium]
MKTWRVLVADDHPIVRRGTCELLAEAEDLEVVGEAGNGEEAIAQVERLSPDVLVMDLSMPVMDGVEATRRLKGTRPGLGIVILSAHGEEDVVLRALQAGANGYLLKTADEEQLYEAVRLVAAGKPALLQPEVTRAVMGSMRGTPAPAHESLSEREREIVREVAKDLGNKQIATRLGISERTVQQHLSNIFGKLGVGSRTGAVLKALQEGWLTLEETRS